MAKALVFVDVLEDERTSANERRKKMRLARRTLRDALNPFDSPEAKFQSIYRLSRVCAKWLIDTLDSDLPQPKRNTAIPNHVKVLAALNFYATGCLQGKTVNDITASLSQPSRSHIIKTVTQTLNGNLMARWIRYPVNQEQRDKVKQRFLEAAKFPGVIGCVDCTHIAIPVAGHNDHQYVNADGYRSLSVQVVSNYDLNILAMKVSPGGNHDQVIWNESRVHEFLQSSFTKGELNKEWTLGNSQYTSAPWFLVPMQDQPPDTPGSRYTDAHASTLRCVERCIGALKGRWKCLSKEHTLYYDPTDAGLIVNACCVLHNIANYHKLPLPKLTRDDVESTRLETLPAVEVSSCELEGMDTRYRIIREHFTDVQQHQ